MGTIHSSKVVLMLRVCVRFDDWESFLNVNIQTDFKYLNYELQSWTAT